METFDAHPRKLDTGIEIWKDRIQIWFNRAAAAYHKNQINVSRDALYRSWQYQQALAELEGKEEPDPPNEPEFYFGRRDFSNPNWGFGRQALDWSLCQLGTGSNGTHPEFKDLFAVCVDELLHSCRQC